MKVALIACTVNFNEDAWMEAGWSFYDDYRSSPTAADAVAEFAGRACYQSWSRPNPATATNEGYLAHILEVGHESVLEHSSATFYVSEVSRSLLAEITRHRPLSFSVLSQRYVNETDAVAIIPPLLERLARETTLDAASRVGAHMRHALIQYDALVETLREHFPDLPIKQIREAARSVLPQATETKFVVTGNLRAWRDVLRKRLAPGADAEMQLFARAILAELKKIAPNTFQDFKEE